MVAWSWALLVGEDPTVAFSYHAPSGIRRLRTGHDLGHRSSTFRPAPSHTRITTSRGGPVRSSTGTRPSRMGTPSGASNDASTSDAWVGAMSASVTGRWTGPIGFTCPGPYQNIGTSDVKAHGPTWGSPAPTK